MTAPRPAPRRAAMLGAAVAVFLAAAAFYGRTLHGAVEAADSGELQVAAWTFSIPHPPGYPLYTLLAALAAHFPLGDSPYARLALLSALIAAATLGVLQLSTMASARMRSGVVALAGLVPVVGLAVSATFWAQATTTNIRILTALFAALQALAVVLIDRSRRDADPAYADRALALFGVALGLGVGHHPSLLFPALVLGPFALGAWLRTRTTGRAKVFLKIVGLVALTGLVWLLLPLRNRAAGPLDHADFATLPGLLDHALARGFGGDFFYFLTVEPERLLDRLAILPDLLQMQFSPTLLLLFALGWLLALRARRGLALALLGAVLVHLFVTLTYRAPQTVEYALPAWTLLALGAGIGLAAATDGVRAGEGAAPRWVAALLTLAAVLVALLDGNQRAPSFAALAQDRSDDALARATLQGAPPNGRILAQWHQATPMWALQQVEGVRPDVRVQYAYPEGAEPYATTFARRAADADLVTTVYDTAFAERQLCVDAVAALPVWRVGACPLPKAAQAVDLAVFDGRLAVTGLEASGDLVPGGVLLVKVGWEARGALRPGEALTVRLRYPDGRLAANVDVPVDPGQAPGEARSRLIALGIPPDFAAGPQRLFVGAYRAELGGFTPLRDAHGQDFPALADWTLRPAALPPVTRRPAAEAQRCEVGAGGPVLLGVDYDLGVPGQMRAYVHLAAAQPASIGLASDVAAPLLRDVPGAGCTTAVFDLPPTNTMTLTLAGRPLRLPAPQPGERYVPFAGGFTLMAAEVEACPAGPAVALAWQSALPQTRDVKVSVRLTGGGQFARHDGVPALGALPTLKWIAGTRLRDVHVFDGQPQAAAAAGEVLLYDNFSQLPLPVLDVRYERAGAPLFR
ncbi:MAG: DUF2723 domain-containing protein [Thermoflexales bacterium]|nr:DUF2723 domain-containing protein [Thermoflexales bacterium]